MVGRSRRHRYTRRAEARARRREYIAHIVTVDRVVAIRESGFESLEWSVLLDDGSAGKFGVVGVGRNRSCYLTGAFVHTFRHLRECDIGFIRMEGTNGRRMGQIASGLSTTERSTARISGDLARGVDHEAERGPSVDVERREEVAVG